MQRTRVEYLHAQRRAGPAAIAAEGDDPPSPSRVTLRSALARLAAVEPVHLRVEDLAVVTSDGLSRCRYVFTHDRRERIQAVLVAPSTGGRHPAVLVSPGRNARLEQVTSVEEADFPDRAMAEHLARAGFVTLTLDYGIDGQYEAAALGGRDAAAVLDDILVLHGSSLLASLVEDALAALRWLGEQELVDGERTGLFGHSLGGAVALHAALLADRPRPVCVASHLGSYCRLHQRLTAAAGAAIPGILRYGELADLYAALAPAPLRLQYGTTDPYLEPHDAAAAAQVIRAGYETVNASSAVGIREFAMGHGTDVADAVDFFREVLAAQPATPGGAVAERPVGVPAARVMFDVGSRIEILDRVDHAVATGALTLGPFGRRIERLAARWTGRPTAAVSSGSSSLEIALRIIGVAGRRVLVPANTFFATAASAIRAGAVVDFVDVEPDGLGLATDALRAALDTHSDVAAVVPVHIAGVVSPAVTALIDLCAQRGIAVVEDAAHALGSTYNGVLAGSFGRMGCFSLYPTKVATSGEGGLLTCAEPDDLTDVHRYRDQGKASFEQNLHAVLGSNWRLSELHAAVGIAHLERFGEILAERRQLAAWYDEHLSDLPKLRAFRQPPGSNSNYYKYVAMLEESIDRDKLKLRLRRQHRVSLSGEVYDTLLHEQPYFAKDFASRRFPRAEGFARHHVCLPLYCGMTEREQQSVVTALREELT